MPYLTEFITVAAIHLLAAMSPGPDFALISRNSLIYSRKTAIFTSLGLALGIAVHIAYSLLGIGLIISQSILLFSIIKYLGAGYLIYIGYKSFKSRPKKISENFTETKKTLSSVAAVRMGFLSNILNPKVTLFFLSLFTQVINQHTPYLIQLLYSLEMCLMTFCWFSFVGIVISHSVVKSRFAKIQHQLEKAFGVILIALGIKVAMTNAK